MIRQLALLPLLLLQVACPAPDEGDGEVDYTLVSDNFANPLINLPGMGGQDPGAGLPDDPAFSACTWQKLVSDHEYSWSARFEDGVQQTVSEQFDGSPLTEARYVREDDHIVGLDRDYLGAETHYTFFWDGELVQSAVMDDFTDYDTSWTYDYDAEGHLAGYSEADGSLVVRYDRDEDGRLVRKLVRFGETPRLTVDYAYDDEGRLSAKLFQDLVTEDAPRVAERYTWDGELLVQVVRVDAWVWTYRHDDEGRVIAMDRADADGEIIESWRYDYSCL